MWTRVTPMRFFVAVHDDIDDSRARQAAVVLRDLVALRQVGIEVVLAREARERVHAAMQGTAAPMASSTAWRFSTGSAPGSPRQTGQTFVFGGAPNSAGIRRRSSSSWRAERVLPGRSPAHISAGHLRQPPVRTCFDCKAPPHLSWNTASTHVKSLVEFLLLTEEAWAYPWAYRRHYAAFCFDYRFTSSADCGWESPSCGYSSHDCLVAQHRRPDCEPRPVPAIRRAGHSIASWGATIASGL